ncbi:MAG: nucleotide-binding protein [Deltaproteobacteria bacterium]|nr:nucleotide-binding protein [Deltaproteobacteria bacterium]
MKPRIFIASSVEGLDIAYGVQENLEYDAEITVWAQGIFELSKTTLEDLLDAINSFDFAIFVFSFDDIAKIRGENVKAVRDNVLFELGLFIGKLGKNRSFFIMPREADEIHLPTDILGFKPGTFESNRGDGNLQAALGPCCNQIRKAIKKLGCFRDGLAEMYEPLVGFHETYRKVNWSSLLERADSNIDIVAYYFDSWVNANYEAIVNFFKKRDTKMRVFVANPEDDFIIKNVQRLFPEYSEQTINEKIEHTGERFNKAVIDAGGDPNRFEFYYVPHFLNYSVQCVDNNILVLSIFEMFREMKIDSPALVINLEMSDHLLRFWQKELEGLISKSKKIEFA